ncbi:NHL repeat-containing protein 3-like [Sycon ciliatum]|uniref:NHL repeat-containing protein 3-like n=1 Tax=Sycon ciliatum TaxID=27933 RepID=UPI0020AB4AD7|eukprot:scpid66872/ scgid27770/ NHL repeat-containing protein 3
MNQSKISVVLLLQGVAFLALQLVETTHAAGVRRQPVHSVSGLPSATISYKVDTSWPKNKSLITGQPFSVGVDQALGVVYILQRQGNHPVLLVSAETGKQVGKWTEVDPSPNKVLDTPHGLRLQQATAQQHGHDGRQAGGVQSVWITDVGNMTGHVLRRFTADGNLQDIIGWPGNAGNSTNPLQFGNVAELAFAHDKTSATGNGTGADPPYSFFVVDGDGGPNNRLLRMQHGELHAFSVTWTVGSAGGAPGQFNIPHDVDTDDFGRVVVADRANARLQILRASDGAFVQELTCTQPSQPYGVRFLPQTTADVVYVAVTLLQDHKLSVIRQDMSSKSQCEVVDTVSFSNSSSPHLLDVHRKTGDIFVADITSAEVYKLVSHP